MEDNKMSISHKQALEIASAMDNRATSLNNLCCDLMVENKYLKSKVKNLTIAIIALIGILMMSIFTQTL